MKKHSCAGLCRFAVLIFSLFFLSAADAYADEGGMQYGPVTSEQTSPSGMEAYGPAFAVKGTLANPRTDNSDLPSELGGGSITVLANEGGSSQQLSMVIRSADGKVIVVDGGVEADAPHLLRILKEAGGTVDAWLLTHPQSDHAGGLYAILRDHRDEIDIRGIWYRFFEYEWYSAVDPGEIGMLDHLLEQFSTFPQDRLHKTVSRGEQIILSDQLSFRVLNDPVKSEGAFAVNSSGLMYDITVNGKHLTVLGDMGEEVGNRLLAEGVLNGLVCDYLQLSHHGQQGTGEAFYAACSPKNCIWSTPQWLYDAAENNANGWQTWKTKQWLSKLPVRNHYCIAKGDIVIR